MKRYRKVDMSDLFYRPLEDDIDVNYNSFAYVVD